MNTIQITSKTDANGVMLAAVTYTEAEVLRFIEKAGEVDSTHEKIRTNRYKVRDFFSELDWSDGETTINRGEVNELLTSIGCDKLRTEFKATVTITAYVTGYEAEDEDDASNCIGDDIEVSIGSSADIRVDNIEVDDIEEEN